MGTLADRVLRLLDAAVAAVPRSQPRQGQRDMAVAVDRALRSREHLLVQAGTGTGKSLAYLVPALASGRRVVVATATKALQAQLVDKDLPRLVAALAGPLGRTPTYALAKGRGNYLCLQQVHGGPGAVPEPEGLFEAAPSGLAAQVLRLRGWADDTSSGDRDEVPFPVSDRAWRQVSVSARDCLGRRCPDLVDCFAERAREAAKEADIVVANHALLALHVFTGVSVLPEHEAVVLDEAHEFVASATEALTYELGRGELRRAVSAAADALPVSARELLQDAADALEGLLTTTSPGWVRELPAYAAEVLALVETAVSRAAAELGRDLTELDEAARAQRERTRAALTDVGEAAAQLRAPSVPSATYAVGEPGSVRLRVSPLSVGDAMAGRLFGDTTVVATSATLTLGGSFAHTAEALGLQVGAGAAVGEAFRPVEGEEPPLRWRHLDVGSPFDYRQQGQLWVAADLPLPSSPAWAPAVDALLVELVRAAGGRTLGLFSSTAAAARAAAAVRAALPDVPVLLQGEDTAGALAHRFAADARTCLFGTRSFWQGVDTPGSACQLVVIDRIPFAHVDDPLVQARLEAAGAAGFRSVTLPPAAVLLAQGAGRLVRGAQDRGVVAVLDPRLATASYSPVLLATLPGFYRARSKDAVLASLAAIDAGAPPVQPVGPPPAQRRAAAARR
ncbi:MAG TPA: ATP-dependent DNA helicase [Mycobacteriales bacterium]|nr:ATP-dependent DNA helicase [Mycobacteriales bacterium]